MQSWSLCKKKKKEKIGLFKLSRYHSTLHCRQLLSRLIPTIAQGNTAESQCGFRSNRVTTDLICMLGQKEEKKKRKQKHQQQQTNTHTHKQQQNIGLCAAFVGLIKAFDTVGRDGLWKILARLCCPPKFLTILRELHEGQQGQVENNELLLGGFPISNGVKEGASCTPRCSPSSLASCSVRQKRTS